MTDRDTCTPKRNAPQEHLYKTKRLIGTSPAHVRTKKEAEFPK